MKKNNYKRACISVLTVALLLSTNINNFVVHGSETADTQPDIEESAVLIQEETTTQTEVEIPPQEVPEVQEKETEKDASTGIVSPMVSNMLKDSLVRAGNNAGAFNVTGGTANTDWGYDSVTRILTFNTGGDYTVTGDRTETQDSIVVANNFEGTITIKDVNINVSTITDACAFEVNNNAELTLMIEGENKLQSGPNCAGLQFNDATDKNLTINSNTDGFLIVTGGQSAAGIGGGEMHSGNNIKINGGTITATGVSSAAGIGSGAGSFSKPLRGSNITINGGIVTATGGTYAAGIGGGNYCSGSGITVNGGTVTATGGTNAAGIGGGYYIGSGSDIIINGGIVTASGGELAAGIGGGGYHGSGRNITINGGTVTTTGGTGGTGIGGDNGSASNIIIDGGSVKANSISIPPKNKGGQEVYLAKLDNQDGVSSVKVDETDYKIAGNHSDSDNSLYLYLSGENHIIEIDKGGTTSKTRVKWENNQFTFSPLNAGAFNVTGEISGTDWGYDDVTKILTFNNDGTYTVTGDGSETQDRIVVADNFIGTITIKDINIKPNSGNYLNPLCAFEVKGTANLTLMLEGKNILQSENGKAGLQFNGINDNTLIINSRTSDGALDAIGGDGAPGIGGTDVSNITINGGNINASGSGGGVGIGGVNVKNITINGGNINVDGGNDKPGIGGYIVDKITINGGTITAKSSVTAIGCEEFAKNIEINGGVITATSEYNSAIGSGGRSSFHASQTVDVEKIKITGGTINATSQRRVAIGSSTIKGVVEDIIITGGSITAISGQLTWGSGIGNYLEGNTKNIVIDGGSVKTNKFSIPPKNTAGENVYLAELENQDGVNSLKVDGEDITRNGNHPDNDTSFYLYLSGQHHSINSSTNNYGARWNGSDGFRWITSNSYTLTIPATASVNDTTKDISVSDIEFVDITKKLNVKIGNDSSTLDTNGKLTLKRSDNATMKTTVTIGSTPIAPDFQIFSASDSWNGSKTLNFAVGDPSSILAGTYRETLTFVASVE